MKRMYGVVIPMVTPLTEDDHVDVLSLQRLTDFLIDKGVDCLYPCGTTGEMAYLTDDERILVVETVVRQAACRSLRRSAQRTPPVPFAWPSMLLPAARTAWAW